MLFPFFRWQPVCLFCRNRAEALLCSGCLNDLNALYARSDQQIHTSQANCSLQWCSADYRPPLPQALHDWKHAGHSAFGALFVDLMLNNPPSWLSRWRPDWVLPMPISDERRLKRGFNQCDELAQMLAQVYRWPILPRAAVSRQHKTAQSTLNRAERLQNIQNSFQIHSNFQAAFLGKKVLLIDDICTTGATLGELSGSLKKAGAADVAMWVAARKLMA